MSSRSEALLSDPDAADQHFRQCDHVHAHLPGRAKQKHFGSCSMMRIGWIQMSDQHTRGVHCDHPWRGVPANCAVLPCCPNGSLSIGVHG